ncbi:heparin lyase I family protein [Polycladidibacter hongkongensis]|uniref:heparin lyase I family protein n=1 Tax=Polycladidibacter hongkongensis TaxID=1647556 RepID=UPI00155F1342|nr:heparin lyase I family protein [Pseudovibrio hongkongensis]
MLCVVFPISGAALSQTAPSLAKSPIPPNCTPLRDDFTSFPNYEVWDKPRLQGQTAYHTEDKVVREGTRALAITVSGGDELDVEGNLKHELWENRHKWCRFGEEVYYAFSFRIHSNTRPAGSTRWVIGQWKEQSGGSPFLAQRFDNGVFHITVQHNDTRLLVAKASGDYQRDFKQFVNELKQLLLLDQHGFRRRDDNKRNSDEALTPGLTLNELKEAIAKQDTNKFPFLTEPQSFAATEAVKIELSDTPDLPNPAKGWVDMVYRIRGGTDGSGLIEIWANGVFIARVSGAIGNVAKDGVRQYFKFGHYRDFDRKDLDATLYLDRFRRTTDPTELFVKPTAP